MKIFNKQILSFLFIAGFLLGIKDGYIALWKGDDPQPYHVFDMRANALPIADQLKLRHGIRVDTMTELLSLIDDYL